jgi:hypothetical protein
MKPTLVCTMAMVLGVVALAADQEGISLFNGKDLSGWKFRHPEAKKTWVVVSSVSLDPKDPKRLVGQGTGGGADAVYLSGKDGRGSDLVSEKEFGDCELHVEFTVSKDSNSGVYLMGLYECQILDSWGKKDADLKYGDVGGIYDTKAPSTNASKEPGQWQAFDIIFRAPRFDAAGQKTQNAQFVSVKLNGTEIQKDVEVKGPTTSSLGGPEKAKGPILLQGDHGPVAFRNIRVKGLGGR